MCEQGECKPSAGGLSRGECDTLCRSPTPPTPTPYKPTP
jgi:hypothetical protein